MMTVKEFYRCSDIAGHVVRYYAPSGLLERLRSKTGKTRCSTH
jgi:DNA-binding transcriptional MerR regulator